MIQNGMADPRRFALTASRVLPVSGAIFESRSSSEGARTVQTAVGSPVHAVWDGIVNKVDDFASGEIELLSRDGMHIRYSGVAPGSIRVARDDDVVAGQVLGTVDHRPGGPTALTVRLFDSSGAILDPTLELLGAVDPAEFMIRASKMTASTVVGGSVDDHAEEPVEDVADIVVAAGPVKVATPPTVQPDPIVEPDRIVVEDDPEPVRPNTHDGYDDDDDEDDPELAAWLRSQR